MRQFLLLAILLILTACSATPERSPILSEIPDKSVPQSYSKLRLRARDYAISITEASHKDDWPRLEQLASGLEQTADLLLKADNTPEMHKGNLAMLSSELRKQAKELMVAAQAKDSGKVTEVLTSINRKVREMRDTK
ncbi:MAG: hypothetical protein EBV06_07840 [Planctomycetia bacterium]|nr:hypothetical protein [Planctomycetia bacterium]